MQPALSDKFRAAAAGMLLAELSYPGGVDVYPRRSRREPTTLSILRQSQQRPVPEYLTQLPQPLTAQLISLLPLLLRSHRLDWSRYLAPAAVAAIQLLEAASESLLDGQLPLELLQPVAIPAPAANPAALALHSLLCIPESYRLAVKYAFERSHSSAIAMLTGWLAGAYGGLTSLPLERSSELAALLETGPILDQLWSLSDTLFMQWAGSPETASPSTAAITVLPLQR
ncbi:MAG: hypothetical protein F6J97_14090 [Leptolyngbya sp. SIO4C1]|nr:hypothetical protein [Leptolyngbya sp. SIO4C1]